MVQAGRDLAAAVEQIPGYNPTAADLKPAALKTKMTALATLNDNVASALADTQSASAARLAIYDHPDTGLKSQSNKSKPPSPPNSGDEARSTGRWRGPNIEEIVAAFTEIQGNCSVSGVAGKASRRHLQELTLAVRSVV